MLILDQEHPDVHAEFIAGSFVVQTHVGTDMKVEQTIICSQKSSGGIVDQTKTES